LTVSRPSLKGAFCARNTLGAAIALLAAKISFKADRRRIFTGASPVR
jgi:hypothetical protein